MPAADADTLLSVRAEAARIQRRADEPLLTEHPRGVGRVHSRFKPWHDLLGLDHNPGAWREGAPCQQRALPDAFRPVDARLMKPLGGATAGVDRRLAGRPYGLAPPEVAGALTLAPGPVSAAVVWHPLHRVLSPRRPDTLPLPERLRLPLEPAAHGARDALLRSTERRHAL